MSMRRRLVPWIVFLALIVSGPGAFAAGGGGGGGSYSGSSGGSSSSKRSPQTVAKRHYEAGLRHKEKAWKLEEKAAAETDAEDREKLLARAQKTYEKAIRAQREALRAWDGHYEAQNELGYALRRTGKYQEAIAAYDRALELNSAYFPAVEYRAEAYLSLGQLERVKASYMVLFRNDLKLADQLMTTMDGWLVQQPADQRPAAFVEWLKERKALAGAGDGRSQHDGRSWE